jgi:hypothetical protein
MKTTGGVGRAVQFAYSRVIQRRGRMVGNPETTRWLA